MALAPFPPLPVVALMYNEFSRPLIYLFVSCSRRLYEGVRGYTIRRVVWLFLAQPTRVDYILF